MITLTKIRDLTLSAASHPGRPLHVSSASGLVRQKSFLYVVADDELHLGVFRAEGNEPGHLIRLFDGVLPDAKSDRKRQKPDLEALTLLPAFGDHPHGALLALSSGSEPNRRTGALLGLDADGAVDGSRRALDLSPLLVPLEDKFHALNIEGAVVCGGELRLFQRGNTKHAENAIVGFPLSAVLDVLGSGRTGAIKPAAIHPVDLGQVDGIPFSFTDASALAGGDMVFTAVAEDTADTYNDGPCVAAAVGIVDNDGRLRSFYPLDQPYKVEGVSARVDGDGIRLLLVTDADDADIPAGLFSATIGSNRKFE
jgi:hypothetical protein